MKIFDAARFLDIRKVMSLDHSTLASKLASVPFLSGLDVDSLCDEYPHYLNAVAVVPANELSSMSEDDVCTFLVLASSAIVSYRYFNFLPNDCRSNIGESFVSNLQSCNHLQLCPNESSQFLRNISEIINLPH